MEANVQRPTSNAQRRTKKAARQRVVITLVDDETAPSGFTADLTFEPSHRRIVGNSPAANAALHLARIIVTAKDALAQPIPKPNQPAAPRLVGVNGQPIQTP